MISKRSLTWKLLIGVMIPFILVGALPRSGCRCMMQGEDSIHGCCSALDQQDGNFVPKCCRILTRVKAKSKAVIVVAPIPKTHENLSDGDQVSVEDSDKVCHCGMVQGNIGTPPSSYPPSISYFAIGREAIEFAVPGLPFMGQQLALHAPVFHRSMDRVALFSTLVI
jgi:hypothetical protein